MRHKTSIALPTSPPSASSGWSAQRAPSRGPRVLVVELPSFRLERCGWQAQEPVALLAEQRSALRIQAMTEAARRQGLLPGMSISEARALCPQIRVELLAEPQEEAQDLLGLARMLQCFGPESHPVSPQAIAVRVGGSARRLGGERAVLGKARSLLRDLGHQHRLVIADTTQVALALARSLKRDQIVPPGESAQALAGVPLASLEPEPHLAQVLASVGILHFGELAALPPSSVATRFGLPGVRLWRIATGQAADHRPPSPPTEDGLISFRRQLLDPIEQVQGVIASLEPLCERLQTALSVLELAALRLQLRLGVEQEPDFLLPLRLGQPRRGAAELMRLLTRRLENLRLPGRVTDVTLQVLESCPFVGKQQGLLDVQGTQEPLADLVARLQDSLGAEACFSPALCSSHRPEHGWSAEGWPRRRASAQSVQESVDVLRCDRPTLLLRDPLPIRCTQHPDGRLATVQVDRSACPVRLQGPPERLQGGWWEQSPFDREYRRVVLADGRQAWVYLEDDCWWLHGWWD